MLDVSAWVLLLGMGSSLLPAASEPAAAAVQPPEPSFLDRLQVHGFLTQAYAESTFLTDEPVGTEQILGIPEDGTTDYRNLAIQFRYEISPKDIAVVQLSHRRLGKSPIHEVEDEVELDWAFYERRLGASGYLKVGRIQIPLGIFNEIRDVGTLLPFFRPAYLFYREGSFSSETVDGLMLGRSFRAPNRWRFDLDGYYGGWDLVEFAPGGVTGVDNPATIARAEDAIGFHLWVHTPSENIRFGGGGQRFNVRDGFLRRPGEKTTWSDWHLSFDSEFGDFVLRAEYRQYNLLATSLAPTPIDITLDSYYVQAGYQITPKLSIWGQIEKTDATRESASFFEPTQFRFWEDAAIALNYRLNNHVLIKAETHFLELDQVNVVDVLPGGPGGGPLLVWQNTRLDGGRQTIVSLAVSF